MKMLTMLIGIIFGMLVYQLYKYVRYRNDDIDTE